MQKRARHLVGIVAIATTGLLLIVLLWGKLQLGFVRYFDADELAYLHWAHNVFAGRLPYRDFLSYIPPGFLYVVAPLFWVVKGADILAIGRVFSWVVFVGICGVLGVLFVLMRGDKGSQNTTGNWGERMWGLLLPGVILAFLPLPADKFLEIRPDNLAVFFSLVGLVYLVSALQQPETYQRPALTSRWVWAGIWFGVSAMILPKTVPDALFALLVVVCRWLFGDRHHRNLRLGSVAGFVLGGAIPLIVCMAWMGSIIRSAGDANVIWYSLTKLPFEVNAIGKIFYLSPDLFFYPNETFYGQGGMSVGLIANHAVWLLGLLYGVYRLMTPWLARSEDAAGSVWVELLVAGTLLVNVVLFLNWYPMRNAQYLIPIAVFVALYAADALWQGVTACMRRRTITVIAGGILYVVLLAGMYEVNGRVNQPKFLMTNTQDYLVLTSALRNIPKDAYVFDLVGATIYFRDPYYVSGVPFGQWEPYLSRPLPSVTAALEKTDTRYIYEGALGRLQSLPATDVSYILSHYRAVPGLSGWYQR